MGSEVGSTRRRDDIGLIRSTANIYVSPTGNDSNTGLLSSSPFRTIQKAFDFLKNYYILEDAEVIINLAAGKYRISSELLMDHPQGERITLKGAAGVVGNATTISSYTDTTSYSGKVGGKSYIKVMRSLDGGSANTTGERFDMGIRYASPTGIPQTSAASGNYIVVSPFDSSYEIQLNYNTSSLANGNYENNTDPHRYSESESTMRRFFACGGHSIRTNLADFGSYPIVDNRTRNINVYDGVPTTITSRINTFSNPTSTTLYSSGNTSVQARYISTVIQVVGDITALRIKNSALNIQDIAFETRDPITSAAGPASSAGIVVDDNSTLILKQGFVVKNFDIGLHVKNKSLVKQYSDSTNQYQSFTYCKTGILVVDGSTAVLSGVIANGCWNDGFVVNNHSTGEFNSCISIGNGRHGFIATRNSSIISVRCLSAYNMQNVARNFNSSTEAGIGFGCRLNSNLECVGCLSFRNGFGYFADKNSALNVSSSDSMDNVNRAASITESSSGNLGPFFYSLADCCGQVVSDTSFCKTSFSDFDYSGFESPSGVSGSALSVAASSNLNLYKVNVNNHAVNGLETLYASTVTSEGLNVAKHANTEGDSVHATYQSCIRLAGTSLGNGAVNQYSLLNGYVELNGVRLDGN